MSSIAATTTSGNAQKRGSLIIAGTGIASVAQMTLETVSYLKQADRVFYSVGDPVTQAFIQENNNNAIDLSVYYERSKERYQTYVEMTEVMLREVRAGSNVFGLFYGHPGFFVLPSRRALTLAREEGYEARMLPGISSFDYMVSDLEFEPAHYGCAIHEATDILARDRRLDPSMHHVILQIAIAGVTTVEQKENKFQLLIDSLMRDFGPEHKVILYAGAVLPVGGHTVKVVYALEDFLHDQVAGGVDSRSCLYIPPRDIPPLHASVSVTLGLRESSIPLFGGSPHWIGPRFIERVDNGPTESLMVAQLDQHTIPEGHRSLRASSAMRRLMIDLALDPRIGKDFMLDSSDVVERTKGLTEGEILALKLKHERPIMAVMLRASSEEPPAEMMISLASDLDSVSFNTSPYCIAF